MSNHPLHRRPSTTAAALAFAATVTLSLLATISMLAGRYQAEPLIAQSAATVAQHSASAVPPPRA